MADLIAYHPDPEINAGVILDAIAAEVADLRAGYLPRRWKCPDCGRSHSRGHFMSIGVHRCLWCGYVGIGGVMWDPENESEPEPLEASDGR